MKFTTPELAIAKLARKVLASQARFILGYWAVAKGTSEVANTFFKSRKDTRRVLFDTIPDADGLFTQANDPKACRWCAEGAIMKAAGDLGYDDKKAQGCIETVNAALGQNRRSIQSINGRQGHTATVKALDKAIAKMEREAKLVVKC